MLIITSPLNSYETLTLLNQLHIYHHSKILIIDTIGTIFTKQNEFYKTINRHKEKWMTSNLLVLTTLTAKLKRFLNATFTTEYNNIYGKTDVDSWSLTLNDTSKQVAEHRAEREEFVIELLSKRIFNGTKLVDGDAAARNSSHRHRDRNILVNFNATELDVIGFVFEKFFNDSCSVVRLSQISEKEQPPVEIVSRGSDSDVVQQNENITRNPDDSHNAERRIVCAPNANSLKKCESYIRKAILNDDSKFINTSSSLNITKVLCEQLLQRYINVTLKPGNKSSNIHQRHHYDGQSDGNDTKMNKPFTIMRERQTNATNTTNEFINVIPNENDKKFTEFFPFFDFIVTKLVQKYNLTVNYNTSTIQSSSTGALNGSIDGGTFDFCVLDFRLNQAATTVDMADGQPNRTVTTTTFAWRPFLILRQSELHQNVYVTHPLTVGYHRWFFDNTHKFWTCGLLCWILAGIVILLLVSILVASITFGLAIR